MISFLLHGLFYIWGGAVIIGTLIPLMREQTYWLRAWTYARLQMLALSIISIAVLLWGLGLTPLLHKILMGGFIFCIGICLWDIIPFTRLWHKQVPTLRSGEPHIAIKIFVGNVLMENEDTSAFLAQIKQADADIVFLAETNARWREGLSELEAAYPHRHLLPLEAHNGMLFYSRFPILDTQERYLVQDHIPSLTLKLDVGYFEPLTFYGVHPRPPRPEDATKFLDQELLFVANEAGHVSAPTIVTGDLNDVGWSSTTKRFLRTSGLRDPRKGRGLYNSYNAKNLIVRWPLDHLFHSRHFKLIKMRRLPASGSDHFPLLIELGLVKE